MITGYSVGMDAFGTNVIRAVTIDGSDSDQLKALQGIVGGYIEAVPTDGSLTIYCNEEGKYADDRYRNTFAELLWATVDEFGCIADGDWLAGTVAVFGPVDKSELTSAPEGTLDKLIELAQTTGRPTVDFK